MAAASGYKQKFPADSSREAELLWFAHSGSYPQDKLDQLCLTCEKRCLANPSTEIANDWGSVVS